MKRRWNGRVWAGFAIVLVAVLSYVPIFVRFPITRDFPWVNLLLFALGGWLLAGGMKRAFGQPDRYRGKITGTVFSVLALALCALFCWGNFVFARQMPSAGAAPKVGQQAPDFTLADASGRPVTLADLRKANHAVLLIFYRGYW
jgi:hypothetical protein